MDSRLELLIGKKSIQKLRNSHILIVGIGGVGGYAFEALVRSFIGKITIIDSDNIDISNLNRQIITNQNNVGNSKTEEAKLRAISINPDINVVCKNIFLTEDNLPEVLNEKYDFIIDACDTIKTKIALIYYASFNKIPIISSMGMANKMHPELVEISKLNKTSYDPIAKILRDEFKNKKITVIYSKEKPIVNNKKILGSNAFVPGTAGLMISGYVVNKLINNK